MKPRYMLLVAAYCSAIFYLSSQEAPELPQLGISRIDLAAHMVLYGGLAALVSLGIRRSEWAPRFTLQFLVPVAFATLYGISDEIHQWFVPTRQFDIFDMLANGAGALCVQWVLCRWVWKTEAAPQVPSA